MPSAPRQKTFVAATNFDIDGRRYIKGETYTPDRYHARLLRLVFISQLKEKPDAQ